MTPTWLQGVRGEQVRPLIERDAEVLRVEAGPGTGKTFGLVRRVERILHPDGLSVHGRDVLVVAFNRVIAKQLEAEISSRLNSFEHHGNPTIRTIGLTQRHLPYCISESVFSTGCSVGKWLTSESRCFSWETP